MRDLAFGSGVLLSRLDESSTDAAQFAVVPAAHFHNLDDVHKAERFPFRMVLSPNGLAFGEQLVCAVASPR